MQARVVLAISRHIPLKALQQGIVLGCRFLGAHVDRYDKDAVV